VLDFPSRGLDVRAMLADTRASLRRATTSRQRFLARLAPRAGEPLQQWIATIRPNLTREEARHSIPAHDPRFG